MAESSTNVKWREIVARYQVPSVKRAVWQLVSTLVPLAGALVLMNWSLSVSYWLTLLLAIPAAGLTIRTFIIMHDCGHGSFLPSKTWNNIIGWITGILTTTPYSHWRREHAIHHATSGHLEQRGTGDISTMTVQEYLKASRLRKFWYRIYRNPVILLGFGPAFLFIKHRWPTRGIAGRKEALNVLLT
jgi:omega-6 fatty acid desaturase (delta-12 desaturase)